MNALLDLVMQAAVASGGDPDEWSNLKQLRETGAFGDKAKFAASRLPKHLRPGGNNPMGVIVNFSSEGLHSLSEEECLETFDKVRFVFEYLFTNLTVESEQAAAYEKTLNSLSGGTSAKAK